MSMKCKSPGQRAGKWQSWITPSSRLRLNHNMRWRML
jgi:hypothetical protein